jgi:hypothetical protein
MGQFTQAEVRSAKGRADAIVQTPKFVYVFEFKLNGTAEEALQQINDKGYAAPCAMLRGDFKVYSDFVITDKTVESKIDVWNGQGYALYAGDGIYNAKFNVTEKNPTRLSLETSDVTEITVNGRVVAKRLWHPFEVDITDYISEGENTLELRVTSTYSNFMYNSNPSGIKSARIFTIK